MIHFRRWLYLIIGSSVLCLVIIGCVSARYVESKQYLLDIKTLPEKKIGAGKNVIFVEHVTAVAPFNQLDFLYRINSSQYLTDYYHSFLVSPAEQLEPILVNYLKALGNFNFDTARSSATKNVLRTQIKEFYADYRDRSCPRAVVVLRFTLIKLGNNDRKVILDELLRASVALKDKDTNSLLTAWNKGIRNTVLQGVSLLNSKVNEKSN